MIFRAHYKNLCVVTEFGLYNNLICAVRQRYPEYVTNYAEDMPLFEHRFMLCANT